MPFCTPSHPLASATLRILLLSTTIVVAACTVRPDPIAPSAAVVDAATTRRDMFAAQEPLTSPLTLELALARALRYNLDSRVAMFEQATQVSQLNLLQYEMLPRVAAGAGYFHRDRDYVSSSFSRVTGQTSENQTISQDRIRWTADLTLSWNLLDFGTSYYQARTQADRVLVARERRRRSVNNIFQEVTAAYWQAATAQRLLPRIDRALADARRAVGSAQQLERERAMPLADALRYQRELLELTRQLEAVAEDMRIAQARLAQLMGLPPSTPYSVATIDTAHGQTPRVMHSVEELERVALVNRPEVQEERYNIRIAQNEVRRAMLRFLPNFNPFALVGYDSNSYLYYNNWAEFGLRASLQLLNLVALPTARELGERQVELAEARRMAVSMAVIAQVHVSTQQLGRAQRQFESAQRLAQVERRLNTVTTARGAAEATTELERIRSMASALSAELLRDRAYADVMNAHAALYVALGLDPVPEDLRSEDLDTAARRIREIRMDWTFGRIDIPVFPDPTSASAEAQQEATQQRVPQVVATPPAPPVSSPQPTAQVVAAAQETRVSVGVPLMTSHARGAFAQLAAVESEADAAAAWRALHQRLGSLLSDQPTATIPARVNGRTVWRLRIGPFSEIQAAEAFCSAVRAAGSSCWATATPAARQGLSPVASRPPTQPFTGADVSSAVLGAALAESGQTVALQR